MPDVRTFASQGEAETWLGEFYPELMSAGVRTVTLYEEDRLVPILNKMLTLPEEV